MSQAIVKAFLLGLILCAGTLVVRAGDDDDDTPGGQGRGRDNINARYLLVPPAGAADEDASGNVQLKRNPVRNAIFIRIAGLEPETTYDVVVSRGAQTETVGSITTYPEDVPGDDDDDDGSGRPGSGQLKLDTKREDPLPLGSETVADLVGSTVEIEDSQGTTVLTVDIDEIRRPGKWHGDDDDDDGAGGGGNVWAVLVFDDDNDEVVNNDDEEPDFSTAGRHDASFLRGDSNMDGRVDVADIARSLMTLYRGAELPYCMDAMDTNDDGALDISDTIATINFLFRDGTPPAAPGARGQAGFDSTPDRLFCDETRLIAE